MHDEGDLIERHALRLFAARKEGRSTDLLTEQWPEVSAIQAKAIAKATLAMFGDRRCGYKLGYTSDAMRRQMNITQPNFGELTEQMDFSGRTGISLIHTLIHPRVEPEIALRIGKDVTALPDDPDSLLDAIDAVYPALEIVDTRYHDYVFRFEDNVADNSSAAGFVLGQAHLPDVLKSRGFSVSLASGGDELLRGHSSDAMGGPLKALHWLCRELIHAGIGLPAGSIILTGGLTTAPFLVKGKAVVAEFERLGSVSFAW